MNFKKRVNGSWTDTSHYVHNTSTDTITTLPADLYPNDNNATVGLKGNMSQTGTPTPTNPIYPTECGDKTANLLNADNYYGSYKIGSSYTATVSQFNNTIICPFATSDIGKTYTISCDITEISSTNVRWIATINGVSVNGDGRSNTGQIKLTFTVETENDSLRITYGSGNYTLTIAKVMMNEGSTPLLYEKFGYKIPISSGGTTTPVYLGEVQTTRKIRKLVFKGDETENWGYSSSGNNARVYLAVDSMAKSPSFSTHYQFGAIRTYPNLNEYYINNASSLVIGVDKNSITSAADFKTYLQQQYAAGTPVTVWYVLATPTTGIVNEPLRKIGTYADSVSGITIPTIAGANAIDVDTTLKPSEVSVNYHGWHPVADVHERDNGAWT